MSHPGTTTEGRIATGTNVHPRLVKESRWGHRRHPQLPANPGSRFVCVEDIEGFPQFPMEMSIWQHESAVSYRKETATRTICDPPYDPYRDECEDEVVTYTKYHAARCLESFAIDLLPHQGWKKDSLDGYLTDMGLKRTTTWGKHIGAWFCAVTDV